MLSDISLSFSLIESYSCGSITASVYPMKDRITGSSIKPLAIPKMMIPNHNLKKTMKIYVFAGAKQIMAKNVENPPWNTLDPILLKAYCALYTLLDSLVS